MRLTKYEQETIINFNELEDIAYVFTYNNMWQRHLESKLGFKPIIDNGYGGKEYVLPKVMIRLPRASKKLSDTTKEKLVMNLRPERHLRAENASVLGEKGNNDGY